MPYRTDTPKTTTARAKLNGDIPSLFDRAMKDGGAQILAAIAHRQKIGIECHARHLSKKRKAHERIYPAARILADLGYVTISNSDKAPVNSGFETYTLTDKGWALVGGKPFWMEVAG